jgi:intracellular sulfur oxidation DsrE/DsrF family protein
MNRLLQAIFILFLVTAAGASVFSAERAPWGTAGVADVEYRPQKVLYDLTTANTAELGNVLDRLGYLYKLYGSDPLESSIVVIIHGDAIPFFALDRLEQYSELMARAQSMTVGSTIEFRMCRAAASLMDYRPADIHGFVTMVPMADAEIIRLQQQEGYAYLR